MEWALEHGLKDATELVVTGGSAGGLATFLHMDRAAAAVPSKPLTTLIFFLRLELIRFELFIHRLP